MGLFSKNKTKEEEKVEEVIEEEQEEENTYSFEYVCDNCGNETIFNIDFGKRALDEIKKLNSKCETCGCPLVDKEARDFYNNSGNSE